MPLLPQESQPCETIKIVSKKKRYFSPAAGLTLVALFSLILFGVFHLFGVDSMRSRKIERLAERNREALEDLNGPSAQDIEERRHLIDQNAKYILGAGIFLSLIPVANYLYRRKR